MEHNFSEVIFTTLCACLGLLEDSNEAARMIIPAYQEPENAAQAPRGRDLVYYYVMPEEMPEGSWETQERSEGCPVVNAFPAYTLLVVCYGPHCEENALTIRYFMGLDGAGMPRSILRKAGIWAEASPPAPTVMHEEAGSLWRKRADLVISLRVLERECYFSPQKTIRSIPEVVVHRE